MKARELMIGDWVKETLNGKYRFSQVDGEMLLIMIHYDASIEPIPLTPEIIENNVFVESEIEREEFSDIGLRYTYETQDGSYLIVDYQDSFDNGCGGEYELNENEKFVNCFAGFLADAMDKAYFKEEE